MNNAMFVEDVKVLDKGQITIPKKVRQVLGAEKGNRLMFVEAEIFLLYNFTIIPKEELL